MQQSKYAINSQETFCCCTYIALHKPTKVATINRHYSAKTESAQIPLFVIFVGITIDSVVVLHKDNNNNDNKL